MKWSEICIHTTEEAIEPITNILYEAGAGGVVIEDSMDLAKDGSTEAGATYQLDPNDYPNEGVNVKAYLPVNSFLGETVAEMKQALANLIQYDIHLEPDCLSISERNEEEWATAWKKYYKPVAIGKEFIITPTWIDYQEPVAERKIIELDPGMAFGTGTHPTTVLCIEALESVITTDVRVLDIGTGTGVLAIAAAKLGAESVLGVDLDEVAVQSAKLNVKLNKVQDRVLIRRNDLIKSLKPGYDVIVGNLLAELVIRLAAAQVDDLLNPGGKLIVSGIIRTKKDQVSAALTSAGLTLMETREREDWVCLVAVKEP
ncbi:MAG: 50S ribosomal protein L11 methyltransferase [Sporolactobacillus sp.]